MLAETNIRPDSYPPSRLELVRTDLTGQPGAEPALTRILLDQVAGGERPATVRISRLGRVVAFGRRDRIAPGYRQAVAAATAAGFDVMERLTGGRVAAHSEGTMVLAFTTPDPEPARSTEARFRQASTLVRDGLRDLGVDARIGPLPGEYCPGEWSVNGAGHIKLAGAGQRMIRGAVHLSFVIVASHGELIRDVLDPVHRALGLDWSPDTAGSVADLVPGATAETVEAALLARLGKTAQLVPASLDRELLERAAGAASRFRPE